MVQENPKKMPRKRVGFAVKTRLKPNRWPEYEYRLLRVRWEGAARLRETVGKGGGREGRREREEKFCVWWAPSTTLESCSLAVWAEGRVNGQIPGHVEQALRGVVARRRSERVISNYHRLSMYFKLLIPTLSHSDVSLTYYP